MPVDYSTSEQVLAMSFGKYNRPNAKLTFAEAGALSNAVAGLINASASGAALLEHTRVHLLASASVEMWHRAVHSFLWSVALTKQSPLWASVSGYYASHFVMRAFAHSLGFFKSFAKRKIVQVVLNGGQCECLFLEPNENGEHAFYWKVVKNFPALTGIPLFRSNSERDPTSDCAHRNFANYTDHIGAFLPLDFPSLEVVIANVGKISRMHRFYGTSPSRDAYPDLGNVQILAYQRIVTYREYLDKHVVNNRFWKAHRTPSWCRGIVDFTIEDDRSLEGLSELLNPVAEIG